MLYNRVAELFAGVGGFRLGLERSGWNVVWSNQWEPSMKRQHASECYVMNFGGDNHCCDDIKVVLDKVEDGIIDIPDIDMVVGGFPCQDYSVAKPSNQSHGIEGKKGILWWEIHRFLRLKKPRFLLLENVDRLLKSPSQQRGRDFAVMLSCLAGLGYSVEWRVVNAADYGFPQKRRRVFIFGTKDPTIMGDVFSLAFPIESLGTNFGASFLISHDPYESSVVFGKGLVKSPFGTAGVMIGNDVRTYNVSPDGNTYLFGGSHTLGDIVSKTEVIPAEFYVSDEQIERWVYLKGAKKEKRTNRYDGTEYVYTEGALPFPDSLERPSRTILTGEGGRSPSRFRHIIRGYDGKLRRLVPEELEDLNGFERGWTGGIESLVRRAFLMGNALIVGVAERIGEEIFNRIKKESE